MKKPIRILGVIGFGKSVKDDYNLPKGWTLHGYITNQGYLYSLGNISSLYSFYQFLTEQEVISKIQKYWRKEKLSKINEINHN